MMNTVATFTQKTGLFETGKCNDGFETDRLILRPSSNSRDLEEYHIHLTTEGDFFFQYGMDMTDELLEQADFEDMGTLLLSWVLRCHILHHIQLILQSLSGFVSGVTGKNLEIQLNVSYISCIVPLSDFVSKVVIK